jgi:hypothetical protein
MIHNVNFLAPNFGLPEDLFNYYTDECLRPYLRNLNTRYQASSNGTYVPLLPPIHTAKNFSVNSDMRSQYQRTGGTLYKQADMTADAYAYGSNVRASFKGQSSPLHSSMWCWSVYDLMIPWTKFISHFNNLGESVIFTAGREDNRIYLPIASKFPQFDSRHCIASPSVSEGVERLNGWGYIYKNLNAPRGVLSMFNEQYLRDIGGFDEATAEDILSMANATAFFVENNSISCCLSSSMPEEYIDDSEDVFDMDSPDMQARLGIPQAEETPPVLEVRSYKGFNRVHKASKKAKFTIGFEVEKEDSSVRRSVDADLLYNTTRWAKERDGSLSSYSGYELVSPTYDLYTNDLDNDLKNSEDLRNHIDAQYNTGSCGGHIHLGATGVTGKRLFQMMGPWIPLIYSLYVGRINGRHCKVKKNENIIRDDEKYQSVRIFDNRVELRIISAVPDVDTLLWRRDLLRLICDNLSATPFTILAMMHDKRSKLHKHLRKQYSATNLEKKIQLYVYFANQLLSSDYTRLEKRIPEWERMFTSEQRSHLRAHGFSNYVS